LASVIDQPDRGYSDILIDSDARAGIYRTAVKKSSSYIFDLIVIFDVSALVEMGRIELPSKNETQKIFYKHSLFVC